MTRVLIGIAVALGLVVGAALAAPSFIDWNQYRDQIAARVEQAVGRGVLELIPLRRGTDAHLRVLSAIETRPRSSRPTGLCSASRPSCSPRSSGTPSRIASHVSARYMAPVSR